MVRRPRLQRFAAGLAVLPFSAILAASCGGNDIIDAADSGLDAQVVDSSGRDAPASLDGTIVDSNAADANATDARTDADGAIRADADAGIIDASDASDARDAADARDATDASSDASDASDAAEAGFDASDAADAGLDLLGSAKKFTVLAGSTLTITPAPPLTAIVGNVGVSPGTAIVTLAPGQPTMGVVHAGDPTAATAQSDLTTAYNNLAGMPCLPANDRTGVDLGGKTLAPGVYCFPNTSAGITGALVLDAQGNPNAKWVFQIGSTLTTATTSSVTVINGGSACNVYWQVGSSATLGTGTVFAGNIVALTAITMVKGSTILVGRTLARNGAVTLDGNTISSASCQ